jgi:catechol 2,3-dioxygenase-like lactoylglutathione lyase family enzyme
MTQEILGIHHVTAITGDAQKNVDFYAGVLGQRLVKVTINFDDPSSYHLYYGDDLGRPGTAMTFFAWPGAPQLSRERRRGTRLVTATTYAAPIGALSFWRERLQDGGVTTEIVERFGKPVLSFEDPDGLAIEIAEQEGVESRPFWDGAGIESEYALRGFHSVTMTHSDAALTQDFLGGVMQWKVIETQGERTRFQIGDGNQPGAWVDVLHSSAMRGGMGPGFVHHVAWRVADDEAQKEWHEKIAKLGANISPVMERFYFRSIYFREPGGVLFEIATDKPGFATDETSEKLGTQLQLPPWLEASREQISKALPRLQLPEGGTLP